MLERKDHEGKFEWSYEGDPTRLFPIDYTQKEMTEKIGAAPQTLKKYIWDSSIPGGTMRELLLSGEDVEIPDELKKSSPLPLEAGTLLSEYGKLLLSDPAYKRTLTGIEQPSEAEEKKFVGELYQRLCDYISDEGDAAEKTFYRHILMANDDFAESVLADLWDKQLEMRVQRLKKFAKSASPEMQAIVLTACFRGLDTGAFQLRFGEKTEKEVKRPRESLEKILKDLLSFREKKTREGSAQSVYAVYCVDNVPVNNTDMKDAFYQLNRKEGGVDLLKAARDAYWNNLITKQNSPPFEMVYPSLKRYLDDSAAKITKSNLRKMIRTYCVEYSKRIITQCTLVQLPSAQQLPPGNQYLSQFIMWAQDYLFNRYANYFQETYSLVSESIKLRNYMEGSQLPSLYEIDSIFIKILSSMSIIFLNRAWKFFLDRGILNSDKASPFDDMDVSSDDFSRTIKCAMEFFEIGQYYNYDYASTGVRHMLELQKDTEHPYKWGNLRDYIANSQIPLLCGVLFVILHQLSMDVEKRLMETLSLFIINEAEDDDCE